MPFVHTAAPFVHTYAWLTHVIFQLLISLCAALLGNYTTQTLCPESAGGGIPDVKALLDGSYKRALVTPRAIIAKATGLILGYSAGLSVGKEGPFVHIAVAIADTLMRQPVFKHTARSDAKRLEILACAAAAGVGATFGTPFAAVFFSIEVTGHYFMVRNLPRAFLCALAGTLPMALLSYNNVFSLFSDLPKMAQGYDIPDLMSFTGLGVLCGILGCFFIKLIEKFVRIRNRFIAQEAASRWTPHCPPHWIPHWLGKFDSRSHRRYLYITLVTTLVSIFVYFDLKYGVASSGDQRSITNFMFQTSSVDDLTTLHVWIYFPFKFFITILSVTLPLPVGLFTPVFLIGGTFGRLYGETLLYLGPVFSPHVAASTAAAAGQNAFHPWEFALIGAAAFSAGVTRAISTAVIILELSGEHHLRTPCGVAVITAYYVGNRFTKSVYDCLMDTNETPTLAELPDELKNSTAVEVMEEWVDKPTISLETTVREAIIIIETERYRLTDNHILPVVDRHSTMLLIGTVLLGDLRTAVSNIASAASIMTDGTLLDSQLYFVTYDRGVMKVYGKVTANKLVSKAWTVLLDPAPYQMQDAMQMAKIYLVFRMLKLNQAYVTNQGRLVGLISRKGMRAFVGGREKQRSDSMKSLVSGCNTHIAKELCGWKEEEEEGEDDEEGLFIEDGSGSDDAFIRV